MAYSHGMFKNEKSVYEKRFCVYKLINPINNLPFYIGEGLERRAKFHWNQFLNILDKKSVVTRDDCKNTYKYNELKKIYDVGLEPIIEFIVKNVNKIQSLKLERVFVDRYGLKVDETGILTNLMRDQTISPSMYEHVRAKIRGQKRTDEVKNKIRLKALGRIVSKETREKISKVAKGHRYVPPIMTDELREKRRKACIGLVWINNGIKEDRLKPGEIIPVGFEKGRINKERFKYNIGKTWYNNGEISKIFKSDKEIPEGFVKGRLKK